MANGTAPTIETLSAIVQSHSQQFDTLHTEVANVGQRQETLFGQLSTKMEEQRKDWEAQRRASDAEQRAANAQQITAMAGNRPNFIGILSVSAAVATVFVGVISIIGSMALSPHEKFEIDIKAEMEKGNALLQSEIEKTQDLQQRRNLAMEASTTKVSDDVVKARIELATLEGLEVERHEVYLKDEARHESRENAIDGAQIKRPEIEGMVAALTEQIKSNALSENARTNAVVESLNVVRHDVGTNYTTGDALKGVFERMDKFQTQLNDMHGILSQMHGQSTTVRPAD